MVQSSINFSKTIERQSQQALSQLACICYKKKNNKVKIILITSRGQRRWLIPKGWLIKGKTPIETVITEVWEEAGITGNVTKKSVGIIKYKKYVPNAEALEISAEVYLMKVNKLYKSYPERLERKRKWFTIKEAIKKVDEPQLSKLLHELQSSPVLFT